MHSLRTARRFRRKHDAKPAFPTCLPRLTVRTMHDRTPDRTFAIVTKCEGLKCDHTRPRRQRPGPAATRVGQTANRHEKTLCLRATLGVVVHPPSSRQTAATPSATTPVREGRGAGGAEAPTAVQGGARTKHGKLHMRGAQGAPGAGRSMASRCVPLGRTLTQRLLARQRCLKADNAAHSG